MAQSRALLLIALVLAVPAGARLPDLANSLLPLARDWVGPVQANVSVVEDGEESSALLEAIRARQTELSGWQEALSEREQAVESAQAQLEARLSELAAAEERLAQTLARVDVGAEDDIARLTAVYENMKADTSAALFEQMEPRFAAGFLGRMQPEAAADILSALPTESAYAISVVLAGRNAGAGQ